MGIKKGGLTHSFTNSQAMLVPSQKKGRVLALGRATSHQSFVICNHMDLISRFVSHMDPPGIDIKHCCYVY